MRRTFRAAGTSLPLILLVAFGLRVAFLWNFAAHNPKQALGTVPFLFEAGNIAYSLVTGHGFSSPFRVDTGPTAWMTPVYPLILAGIFRLFGAYTFSAFLAAAMVNILATTLASIPIYAAGKRIGGAGTAAGAAWLWAVFPNAIEIPSTSLWDASIAALLAATILWATLVLAESKGTGLGPWVGYGLLWGSALMTTATLGGLLPFLLAWMVYRRHRLALGWLLRPVLAMAVAALCCLPWAARNYEVFHAFIPLRSILGLQLWVGNNPQAQEIWLGTQHPIHDGAERQKYVDLGEVRYMRDAEQKAMRYMATHPGREANLIWHRFLEFWSGGSPRPITDFLRARSAWFRFVLLFNLVVAGGGAMGIIVLVRSKNACWFPLVVFLAVLPWAYYLTVVLPRYSLPVDPAVMLAVAAGIRFPSPRVEREGARAGWSDPPAT
ncbi:MAG TPA: glycosyltransferase family 39 protein [Candidatus Cybelea sp.]|nr:glycosyltransferase family 39 protein [Candidatus Cybelea sp.]